jgi:hypothetical protein
MSKLNAREAKAFATEFVTRLAHDPDRLTVMLDLVEAIADVGSKDRHVLVSAWLSRVDSRHPWCTSLAAAKCELLLEMGGAA